MDFVVARKAASTQAVHALFRMSRLRLKLVRTALRASVLVHVCMCAYVCVCRKKLYSGLCAWVGVLVP